MERIGTKRNIVRHIKFLEQMIIKSSLKLKSNVKHFKRFSVGNSIEHKKYIK